MFKNFIFSYKREIHCNKTTLTIYIINIVKDVFFLSLCRLGTTIKLNIRTGRICLFAVLKVYGWLFVIISEYNKTVIYELSEIILPSIRTRSSVDRAPARCSGGHGFHSCRGLGMFPLSYAGVVFEFINSPSHCELMMTSILLIPATCRAPVIYELS